jgi:hypothetical protein
MINSLMFGHTPPEPEEESPIVQAERIFAALAEQFKANADTANALASKAFRGLTAALKDVPPPKGVTAGSLHELAAKALELEADTMKALLQLGGDDVSST